MAVVEEGDKEWSVLRRTGSPRDRGTPSCHCYKNRERSGKELSTDLLSRFGSGCVVGCWREARPDRRRGGGRMELWVMRSAVQRSGIAYAVASHASSPSTCSLNVAAFGSKRPLRVGTCRYVAKEWLTLEEVWSSSSSSLRIRGCGYISRKL